MSRCFSTLTRPSMSQSTETARRLHDEVQRNQDGQEAAFSIGQDREEEADCLRQWRSERLAFQNLTQKKEPHYALCDIECTSEDGCSQTKLTCQDVPERIVEQIVDVIVPLSILEETVAVMKLAPHEHAQTGPDGPADAEDS